MVGGSHGGYILPLVGFGRLWGGVVGGPAQKRLRNTGLDELFKTSKVLKFGVKIFLAESTME